MFKKIIFFLFLISLIIYVPGCGSPLKYTVDGILKYKSFLYLTKTLTIKKCGENSCEKPINLKSSASGYIVEVIHDGAYVMTAAHVCDDSADSMLVLGPKKISSKYFVYNSVGKKYRAMVLAYDNKIDACMLYVQWRRRRCGSVYAVSSTGKFWFYDIK
jgi:S1-C subfamily serine protease